MQIEVYTVRSVVAHALAHTPSAELFGLEPCDCDELEYPFEDEDDRERV